jgi:signal transduction histidine kinase
VRPGAVEGTSVRPSALVSALEAERTAVAGNLHDNVVQGLVAARLALDIAERRGADAELLAPVRSALAGAMREARDTLWSLRSRGADGDVLAAFAALADHLAEHEGPDLEVHDAGLPATVSHTAGVLAYRVLQVVADESPAGSLSVDVSGTPAGALRLVICAAGLDETPSTRLLRLFNQVSLCGGSVLPVPAGLVVTIPAGEEPA